MRTETRLRDLQPEFRAALQEASTPQGWDAKKVQAIVAHAYDFLGPYVEARIQFGSALHGDQEGEFLVVDFEAPAGRDAVAAEATYQRACELANAGGAGEALGLLRSLTRDFPEVAKYRRDLGRAYYELGNLDEAEGEFLRALALDPREWSALVMLGNYYQARGAAAKAVPLYQRASELMPDPLCLTNLGAALGTLGDLDAAIGAFQGALALDPHFEKAQLGLQVALSRKTRR